MYVSRFLGATLCVGLLSIAGSANAWGPNDPNRPDNDDERFDSGSKGLVGAIELINDRDRNAKVFVDGVFAADVPAHQRVVLPEVLNGVRLVSYRSGGRRHWQTDQVNVGIDRRAVVRIAPLLGQVLIHNRSGQVVTVKLGNIEVGTAWPGADLESPIVPAGNYVLSAQPYRVHGAPIATQKVVVRGGDTAEAEIAPFFATLVIKNPFPFRVAVFVDNQRVGFVQEHETQRFDTMQPGRARIELRKTGASLAQTVVDLSPTNETYWDGGAAPTFERRAPPIQAALGEVEFVVNSGRIGTLRVELPGLAPFDLRRGESRLVQLPEGPMTATIVGQGGRKPITFEVRGNSRVQIPLRND